MPDTVFETKSETLFKTMSETCLAHDRNLSGQALDLDNLGSHMECGLKRCIDERSCSEPLNNTCQVLHAMRTTALVCESEVVGWAEHFAHHLSLRTI